MFFSKQHFLAMYCWSHSQVQIGIDWIKLIIMSYFLPIWNQWNSRKCCSGSGEIAKKEGFRCSSFAVLRCKASSATLLWQWKPTFGSDIQKNYSSDIEAVICEVWIKPYPKLALSMDLSVKEPNNSFKH